VEAGSGTAAVAVDHDRREPEHLQNELLNRGFDVE
jgi:hypothetical protein